MDIPDEIPQSIKSLNNWLTLLQESRNEKFQRLYLQRVGEAADQISRSVQLELAAWRKNSQT
jgi:hypothetical protein